METVSTTRLSSRGQVVIPETVRRKLGLQTGDAFVVAAEGDVIVLKLIEKPAMEDFQSVINQARDQAKRAGLRRKDIKEAIREVRSYS